MLGFRYSCFARGNKEGKESMGFCGCSVRVTSAKRVDGALSISCWSRAKDYLCASHAAAFLFLFVLPPPRAGADVFCHSFGLRLNTFLRAVPFLSLLTQPCALSSPEDARGLLSVQPQPHAPAISAAFQRSGMISETNWSGMREMLFS